MTTLLFIASICRTKVIPNSSGVVEIHLFHVQLSTSIVYETFPTYPSPSKLEFWSMFGEQHLKKDSKNFSSEKS